MSPTKDGLHGPLMSYSGSSDQRRMANKLRQSWLSCFNQRMWLIATLKMRLKNQIRESNFFFSLEKQKLTSSILENRPKVNFFHCRRKSHWSKSNKIDIHHSLVRLWSIVGISQEIFKWLIRPPKGMSRISCFSFDWPQCQTNHSEVVRFRNEG